MTPSASPVAAAPGTAGPTATQVAATGTAGLFIAKVCAATSWKFMTSCDDLMWLSPFMAQTAGKTVPTIMKLILYLCVVETVVLLASSVLWGSEALAKSMAASGHVVPIHAYLVLTSGSLLSVYSCFLFKEWYDEKFGEGADDSEDDENNGIKELSYKRMIVVSFLGSMDEFASFTTALLGGLFSPLELGLGCIFACSGIAGMCLGALQFKFIADIILAVPIWLIIGTVSMVNIVNGVSELMA